MELKVLLYILAASSDPDSVQCKVPFRIDDKEIFFGPCKKRIREKFKQTYLHNCDYFEPENETYLVGANGANKIKKRKIVFVGKILSVMTFKEAYNRLRNGKYDKMRSDKASPLHVEPIYNPANQHIGYKHISEEHNKNQAWIWDIIKKDEKSSYDLTADSLQLKNPDRNRNKFSRDCCLLLQNIFWSDRTGRHSGMSQNGIDFSDKLLAILKEAQKNPGIDSYAIFGKSNGKVLGLRGGCLEINGKLAENFINEIKKIIKEQ